MRTTNTMGKGLLYTRGQTATLRQIDTWQRRWSVHGQTAATPARWSRPTDTDQRSNDDRQHLIMVSNAHSRYSGPCHLLPWPTPRHPPINPIFPSAQRPPIIPPLICPRLHPQSQQMGCTRLTQTTQAFDIPQTLQITKHRLLDTPWRPRCPSGRATPRIQ